MTREAVSRDNRRAAQRKHTASGWRQAIHDCIVTQGAEYLTSEDKGNLW